MEHDTENKAQNIIIRRVRKMHNKHHGGSWKIAYADFVTAMMSFFLLMWLLSMLNKYQLEGISRYFKKPLHEVFTKQDSIARTNTIKPDKLGPTSEKNTGAKEKTENAVDKNAGQQNKNQKDATQLYNLENAQKPRTPAQLKMDQQYTQNPQQQIKDMKAALEDKMKKDPTISPYMNHLNFVITADGLKITIKDLDGKPMFSQGRTDFQDYAASIVSWLSKAINGYPNRIVIIGHTDTIPYMDSNVYSNWELSADRANATRRALIQAGMSENKVLRVVGGAATDLLDGQAGNDPSNRRIEIIVLTAEAAKQIQDQ